MNERSDGSDTRAAAMRGAGEARVVLVDVDVVDQPELRRVAQRLVGARQVEIARAAGRKIDLAHRRQRHAHQELEPVSRPA